MNKFNRFCRTIPMKLYVLLAAVLLFAFFSNDFGLVDIQKTAIILAAGVDQTENGYAVTAQIAVPKGTERSSCGTSSVEVLGEGVTVSECISEIYSKTGWVPKLIFCNLVILGEDTAKQGVMDELDFFLRNEYMSDSCLVAVCEGKATDFLTLSSAIDDTTSLAISQLFSDAAEKSGKIIKSTLKEFAIGYYGKSNSGYMPFLRATNQQGGCTSNSSGPEGGSSSGAGQNEKKIFSAEETAIFTEGKMVSLLSREETFAYNLLKGKIFAGTFNVEDEEKPVALSILKNDGGISLDMKGAPTAKLNAEITVRLYNSGIPSPIEDMVQSLPTDEAQQNAEKLLQDYVQSLWDNCIENHCDLFNLLRDLYRSSAKKYEEWKDTLLTVVRPQIQLKVISVK